MQRDLMDDQAILSDEVDVAQEHFSAIDRDQDGVLSMHEALVALNRTRGEERGWVGGQNLWNK